MTQQHTRELNRREFLQVAAALGLSTAAAGWIYTAFLANDDPLAEVEEEHNHNNGHPHWIMVIDLEACIGCERCVYACQATNNTAEGHLWNIAIHDEHTFEKPVTVTRPCMQCEHAPCVEVCPVGATFHREDGLVEMDYDRCIGCRYCMVACPYGVRVFNWEKNEATGENNPMAPTWGDPEVEPRPRGVVEKCTFCSHRLDATQDPESPLYHYRPGYDPAATPACCAICPTEARRFGDLHDHDSPAVKSMQGRQVIFLRGDLGTHPRVYYLLPLA